MMWVYKVTEDCQVDVTHLSGNLYDFRVREKDITVYSTLIQDEMVLEDMFNILMDIYCSTLTDSKKRGVGEALMSLTK